MWRTSSRFLFVLVPLFAACAGEAGSDSSTVRSDAPLAFDWPPVVGQTYPDVVLNDFRGERVALSSFRGKVLFIEPIGMT